MSNVTSGAMQVYEGIFADALYAYPAMRDEFKRDLNRLHMLVEQQGIHVLVHSLPALGKHFDKCLASGQFTPTALPLTKRWTRRVKTPKFLRSLYQLVFDDAGRLKQDPDTQAIFFIRQIYLAMKKYTLCASEAAQSATVADFVATDQLLPLPDQVWDQPLGPKFDWNSIYFGFAEEERYQSRLVSSSLPQGVMRRFLDNLDKVSKFVIRSFGTYVPDEWSFRHGPGAVAEASGIVDKYNFSTWSDRLDRAFPIAEFGYHNHLAWAARAHEILDLEIGSRLICVPKTYEKPRLIAAEPMANQWCQQNCWDYYRSRVRTSLLRECITFGDQTRNQKMALAGSRDQRYVTVDLSAASDRLSCTFVGNMFRFNQPLLDAMQACRTTMVTQSISGHLPKEIKLRKFSTMGSACTFPVQTIAFATITIAAIMTSRNIDPSRKEISSMAEEVSVFGDDIIAPKDSWDILVQGLEVLDFKVNVDKSFSEGNFRESCGVDAFRGEDVTPSYFKAPCSGGPESVAATVETANNFYKKFLVATSNVVASTLPENLKFPMQPIRSGVISLKTFVAPPIESLKTRWNESLQRLEFQMPLIKGQMKSTPRTDDSALHQYFTDAPLPSTPWKAGVPQRPVTKLRPGWVPVE